MITSQRTMPESEFRPEDSFKDSFTESQDAATDEPLNASELQTVLDMLAVMETAEELVQLQALTEAQKRQVWEATPEALKQKLWQLRNQPATLQTVESPIANERPADDRAAAAELEAEAELDDEIEALGQDLELTAESYPSLPTSTEMPLAVTVQPDQTTFADRVESLNVDRLSPTRPTAGAWIILKAHPQLSASELKAIWQLEQIEGSDGFVSHAILGTRSYPLSWMVVYPQGQTEQAENPTALLDDDWNTLDSEEPF